MRGGQCRRGGLRCVQIAWKISVTEVRLGLGKKAQDRQKTRLLPSGAKAAVVRETN